MTALDRFKMNLAARASHPLATALSDLFAEESFRLDVRDLEAEGARLIGALPCPYGVHGDEVGPDEIVPGDLPCPSCGAAL